MSGDEVPLDRRELHPESDDLAYCPYSSHCVFVYVQLLSDAYSLRIFPRTLHDLRYPLLKRRKIQVHLESRHLVETAVDRQLSREQEHGEGRDGDILVFWVALRAVRDARPQVDPVADDV